MNSLSCTLKHDGSRVNNLDDFMFMKISDTLKHNRNNMNLLLTLNINSNISNLAIPNQVSIQLKQ